MSKILTVVVVLTLFQSAFAEDEVKKFFEVKQRVRLSLWHNGIYQKANNLPDKKTAIKVPIELETALEEFEK